MRDWGILVRREMDHIRPSPLEGIEIKDPKNENFQSYRALGIGGVFVSGDEMVYMTHCVMRVECRGGGAEREMPNACALTVHLTLHLLREERVHHTMARQEWLTLELLRDNDHLP